MPAGSVGAEMDWAGWALFGVIATSTLTALMITTQLAGLTRLDLPLVLGSLVTADPDLTLSKAAGLILGLATWRFLTTYVVRRQYLDAGQGGLRRWLATHAPPPRDGLNAG